MSSTTVINTSTINAPLCEDLSDTHRCPTHRSTNTNKLDGGRFPEVKRPPNQLPDPWLFDSEKLLRELDRCREMVLLIPAFTHESHFTINNAIDSLWNLRETVQFLLKLHKEGQRAFRSDAAKWFCSFPHSLTTVISPSIMRSTHSGICEKQSSSSLSCTKKGNELSDLMPRNGSAHSRIHSRQSFHHQ